MRSVSSPSVCFPGPGVGVTPALGLHGETPGFSLERCGFVTAGFWLCAVPEMSRGTFVLRSSAASKRPGSVGGQGPGPTEDCWGELSLNKLG